MPDQNQSRNSLTNMIITPNSNKSDFYNSCNSIEVPFDDDNHHILINPKNILIIMKLMPLNQKKTISVFSI